MKRFILLCILLYSSHFLMAQDFNRAIGIRGGLTSGFEYRFYADELSSVKILLGTNNGIRLHGLYEVHRPYLFLFTDQLTLYYGAGLHGGYENWDEIYVRDNKRWHEDKAAFVMGIDGLAGLEYRFYEAPLSLGLESKPYFDIFGRNMFHFEPFDMAFTVKYHF